MSTTYPKGPVASMKYAARGIVEAWRDGLYFRIGVIVAMFLFIVSYILGLSKIDFLIVLILIGVVLAAEVFNTAIEKICDVLCPAHDVRVALIKDMSAGAVLIVGSTAAIAGLVLFLPYVL